MGDALVSIDTKSIDEAIAGLKATERNLAREDRRAFREVADTTAGWVKGAASSGTRAQQHFAGAIRPRSTSSLARLAVLSTGRNAGAGATFWGAKRQTGWNAKHAHSRPQFPKWVGASWVAGRPGQGPYVFRDVIPARQAAIGRMIEQARMRAFSSAFPKGG
jgi:hypothetical protein